MGFTCKICERQFILERKTGICPSCNSLLHQMSKTVPYQERMEVLRQQIKYGIFGEVPLQTPINLRDALQMKACRHCVWSRFVDRDHLRVRCALPTCAKKWGKPGC